jgi:dTDP-4-amino-4,6-dideoxygalactose transaminase
MSEVQKPMSLPSDQDATGRTLGDEEIAALTAVIKSGHLWTNRGTTGKALEERFAQMMGAKACYAVTSGTAAIHAAVAAVDPNPGDEIITTSITDMGALTPILYQGAIPVFCDVDPRTYNVTAATIERCLSPRTKAIIVTHLFGNPCDMDEIMALANARRIPVIEDSAQSYFARANGRLVGTIGAIGCFSLQQGKHITTGEGGLVISSDPELARRLFLFINKAWGYGDAKPDHYFLALNYRISEMQGAVAYAQLPKLEGVVKARVALADAMTRKLAGIEGFETPYRNPKHFHTYWKYCLRVDGNRIVDGAVGLAKHLKDLGVASGPRYIVKPSFMCEVFQKQRTFGDSRWPFTLARPEAVNYDRALFPGTYDALEHILVLPWNERYTEEHLDFLAGAIREAAARSKK